MKHAGDQEPPSRSISRRTFVVGTAAGAVGVVGLGYSGLAVARDDLRPDLDPSAPTGRLGDRQMATILALSEALVPDRFRIESGRVRQVVEQATDREPGLLQEYERGAVFLDGLSNQAFGTDFHELSAERREGLLDQLLWRYPAERGEGLDDLIPKVKRRLERIWHREDGRRFRQLVVRDLLRRVYLAGVPLLIGYSNLPGVPGDPREYVRPPQGRPDLAPPPNPPPEPALRGSDAHPS